MKRSTLTPDHPEYPARLRALPSPPRSITVAGSLATDARRVAIVGSRLAEPIALEHARSIAFAVASLGCVVVSGGALGVDTAAHEGALDAGGATWFIAGTASELISPPANASLFRRIEESPKGAVVWPFPPGHELVPGDFKKRNVILVALADVLLVVQARLNSGTSNAASNAAQMGRPVYVMTGFGGAAHAGCFALIDRHGARVYRELEDLLTSPPRAPTRGHARTPKPRPSPPRATPTAFSHPLSAHLTERPQHAEQIAKASGIPLPRTWTELLTLALQDVVVEGPPGHFRRRI